MRGEKRRKEEEREQQKRGKKNEKEGKKKGEGGGGMTGKATGKPRQLSRSMPLPVQGLIHSAQHDLQDGISREAIPIIYRLPANRVDHIPDAESLSQSVVERFQ